MLEARTIIDQVQQNDYPLDWRIYRGHGQWGKAILWIFFYWFALYAGSSTLLMIVILCLASGTSELAFSTYARFLAYSVLFVFIIGLPGIAIPILRKAQTAASTLLVILSDSVFLCYKGSPEKTRTFAFADIMNIQLGQHTEVPHSGGRSIRKTTITYWLDLYTRDGHYLKWPLDNALGELDSVGKDIIAAHQHYWHHL